MLFYFSVFKIMISWGLSQWVKFLPGMRVTLALILDIT